MLRHRTFFTLADLNDAIATRIDAINARPMKVLGVNRRTLFEQVDRPALRPLPRTRYELAEWRVCRVNIDYHAEADHNFYSVPYQLVHERVDARVTAATVEVFFKGRRVAAHARLANIDGDRLVYLVDSPVWHARLRLAASELVDVARSLGLDVTRLVVRTTRQLPGAQAQAGPAAVPMSATARESLRDALACLRGPEDGPEKDES